MIYANTNTEFLVEFKNKIDIDLGKNSYNSNMKMRIL